MPALDVRGVVKAYDRKTAVDDVSFSVERGELFGLLGPNGAGKSTLIRMVMDIIRPDTGEIRVLDRPIDAPLKERIGYLPEERGLYQRQKVGDVLRFLGELKGLPRHVAARRAEHYLDRVGLLTSLGRRMRELSKGMQQKVQIAAVLLAEPEMVILDEPFEGLDPVNREMITDLVKDTRARGATVILSSHRMEQVEAMCPKVLLLSAGKAVLSGGVREIQERFADNSVIVQADRDLSAHPRVARSEPAGEAMRAWLKEGVPPEQFLSEILAEGVRILRFERALPTLDEVFRRAVKS